MRMIIIIIISIIVMAHDDCPEAECKQELVFLMIVPIPAPAASDSL